MKKFFSATLLIALVTSLLATAPTASYAATKKQTATVSFVGSPRIGDSIISTVTGLKSGTRNTYKWKVNGVVVSNEPTLYLDNSTPSGASIVLSILGKKSGYKDWTYTSPTFTEGAITRLANGSVSGDALAGDGQTVTASCGTFLPDLGDNSGQATCSYQWKANGTDIAGEVTDTLALGENLIGQNISVVTTVSSDGMADRTFSYSLTGVVKGLLAVTADPTFTEASLVGDTVEVAAPSYSADPDNYRIQWYRGTKKISGATGTSYDLVAADWHKQISVTITAMKANYADSVQNWTAVDYVLKVTSKVGPALNGYRAWDSCDYYDVSSYDCWGSNSNKYANGMNMNYNGSDDYTNMNLSNYSPVSTDSIISWRAIIKGTVSKYLDIYVGTATDEGVDFDNYDDAVFYANSGTWKTSWTTTAPTDDGLLHFWVQANDSDTYVFGTFTVKSVQIEVQYIG